MQSFIFTLFSNKKKRGGGVGKEEGIIKLIISFQICYTLVPSKNRAEF